MPVPTLLTAAQLAERWACGIQHLANMRSAATGPAFIKLGRSVRYRLVDVEAYEAERLVATDEQAVA